MLRALVRLAGALSIAAMCATAAVPAVAADGPTLERIRSTATITLAYREGAAPFSFRDREGRVRGYSAELCMLVGASIQKSLGLPSLRIDWKPVDAATRLFTIANGDADIECGTTTITLSRMEKVDFSVPIFVDGGSVLVKRGAKIGRLANLKGRKVAVIPATTTEQALTRELCGGGVSPRRSFRSGDGAPRAWPRCKPAASTVAWPAIASCSPGCASARATPTRSR